MLHFKHNTKPVIISFGCEAIADFCAGEIWCEARSDAKGAEEEYEEILEGASSWSPVPAIAPNILVALIDRMSSSCLMVNDCKGGCWDELLFSYLEKKRVRSRKYDGYLYNFYLTPWFKNENSGNMVRSLTVIRRAVKKKVVK